jgi:16S rRNA U516 pseudouridylate synthase RsuA-like enzyme
MSHVLGHPTPKSTLGSMIVNQGRNGQIRLMFHACGPGIMKLHRTAVGADLSLSLAIRSIGSVVWQIARWSQRIFTRCFERLKMVVAHQTRLFVCKDLGSMLTLAGQMPS